MPRCPTTGVVTRARYTMLKLNELSSVDRPAQVGATAVIMKRADLVPPVRKGAASLIAVAVAKYVGCDDGAHTFADVLSENEFSEEIWPLVDAFTQAIRSIMGDTSIVAADRETMVADSVDQFLTAVRGISPDVAADSEKRLARIITKRSDSMKTIEQLEAEIATLKAMSAEDKAKAKAALDAANAKTTKVEADLTAEQAAHADTKKALVTATDEVIKVDGKDVRKSEVGEASFIVFKSLDNRAVTAELEKRASDDFGHVAGTSTEKALVLKHAATMDEPTRKAFDAIMTSAEAMAKGGFSRFGGGGGNAPSDADVEKAQATYKGKVAEIAKRDGIAEHEAMRKARAEFPAEYEAAYPKASAA